jgi:hypothetical protein
MVRYTCRKLTFESKKPGCDAQVPNKRANGSAAISEGHGDAALLLLREGAESDKKDLDERLAIDTAPDAKVCQISFG